MTQPDSSAPKTSKAAAIAVALFLLCGGWAIPLLLLNVWLNSR